MSKQKTPEQQTTDQKQYTMMFEEYCAIYHPDLLLESEDFEEINEGRGEKIEKKLAKAGEDAGALDKLIFSVFAQQVNHPVSGSNLKAAISKAPVDQKKALLQNVADAYKNKQVKAYPKLSIRGGKLGFQGSTGGGSNLTVGA